MLQSLRNVAGFLDQHADQLQGVVQTGARQRLDTVITALETHASDQSGGTIGSKGATQKQRALRRALIRDHMTPIARIAAADLPRTPELEALRLPKGRPTSQKLAAAAHGMAEKAAVFAQVFTRAGLPDDFVAALIAAADAMIASISERESNRNAVRGATESLATKLAESRRVVHVLDAFVQSKLQSDDGLLASWNRAKRVLRVSGGRPASIETTPVPGTSSTPPAPTA
jgi:hypothetical protein